MGEIVKHFNVTQGSISQNLAVLREAGLVSRRSEGNLRFYRANQEALGELKPFLERMWGSSLDRLAEVMVKDRADRD